jgi:peroxiredoxin
MLQTGDKAPDFTLPNHKRERVSLAGLQGKTVVLAFFPPPSPASARRRCAPFATRSPRSTT